MKVTVQDVEKIVDHWVPRFHLERWEWRILVVGPGSLEGAEGDNMSDPESRTAIIRINERQESEFEFHDTVIHEMLHCVFWFSDYEGIKATLEEQAFRDITGYLAEISVEELS